MGPAAIKAFIDHLRAFRRDEGGFTSVDLLMVTSSVVMLGAAHLHDLSREQIGDPEPNGGLAGAIETCIGTHIADLVVDNDPETYTANLEAAIAACWSI